ncbi:MAG: hypothetical protein ACJA17_001356 [Polaribacter sp.]|jgi:hypothetical protein|uniref:hypothetical protein n=1 Tax=Polaribacter sp. TaxID=1920175 RepID=UPI003AE57325
MKIYKYINITDNSFENFKNGELYFNNPSKFKDINDSNLKIKEIEFNTFLKKSIEYINEIPKEKLEKMEPPKGYYEMLNKSKSKGFLERFNEFKNNFVGVTCFSESDDIEKMWKDYASENSGFCICFETNYDIDYFNGLTKIKYVEELPIVDLKSENFENGLHEFYTTKLSKDYFFEEEQRLIKKNLGLFKYKKECVEEIILGNKMSKPTKKKIINILKENYFSDVFVTQN